jgi:hypothetical protein
MKLSSESEAAVNGCAIGVIAWVASNGKPITCAVTPYVVDNRFVVTSTLAYPGKARALRADPRISVLAGGWSLNGVAQVGVDQTSRWFDSHLREQELRKYPPAKSLLSIPGHRTLFPFYVGRIVVTVDLNELNRVDGSDRASIAYFDKGTLKLAPIPRAAAHETDFEQTNPFSVPGDWPDGPAEILVHEESPDLADLRQLRISGVIRDRVFTETRRVGHLEAQSSSTRKQLGQLLALGRLAKAARHEVSTWPRIERN